MIQQERKADLAKLLEAENKAIALFDEIVNRGLIREGITELELNKAIFELAFELQGIRTFWHKRIVRAGKNTLLPYAENPPDLTLRENEILFLDFGPVYEEWEADLGRTYVLGDDERMHHLKSDTERLWSEGAAYFQKYFETLTGADFYGYTKQLAQASGWKFGNIHCGHLIGNFPHEKLSGEDKRNYLHPDNHDLLSLPDLSGRKRYWIYEMHLVDAEAQIGAFVEQVIVI
jgi:Xaa-Pro aminopeptidase